MIWDRWAKGALSVIKPETITCKLCITKKLNFNLYDSPNWQFYMSAIHRFENSSLEFCCEKIYYSNLRDVAEKGTCRKLRIDDCHVINSQDAKIPLGKIFKLFPGAQSYNL